MIVITLFDFCDDYDYQVTFDSCPEACKWLECSMYDLNCVLNCGVEREDWTVYIDRSDWAPHLRNNGRGAI